MNLTSISVVQGDHGYNLGFTLLRADATAVDLSAISAIAFSGQQAGAADVKFTGSMTVDVAANGTCHYVVQATDFDAKGKYWGQIVVTFASGQVLTYSNIEIIVAPTLPRS